MADDEPEMTAAEEVYVAFLEAEGADFESLCAGHPELEEELRRLHQQREQLLRCGTELDRHSLFRSAPASSIGTSSARVGPGETIGDFRLIRELGRGGMGQVWEAEQLSFSRRVALKFIRPEVLTSRHLAFFEREARAGGRLSHPGIVGVHSKGESDGLSWMAMELVEGGRTLRDLIDATPRDDALPLDHDRRVARLIRDMALAVHAAHEAGVIHRDLKPQNILVTAAGEPRVTDFGLARILDESALSRTGEVAGTYYYMSPEQVNAERTKLDHRTDIFSLGVVLYEMLTLQRPFQGDTTQQIAIQITTNEPPDPRTIRSRVPHELVTICGKALEKAPPRRYATMLELAEDLDRFLKHEPILAKPPTRIERMVKWSRRNPTKSVAGAVVVLAFVVISVLALRLGQVAAAEKKRADEVLQLSFSQNYDLLVAQADQLWPAYPGMINAYEDWIAEAKDLAGRVPDLKARREELRRESIHRTEEERREQRENHPGFGELTALAARVVSLRNALAVRRGEREPELPSVNWNNYPEDAVGLHHVAWPLVGPARTEFGREALGLVLAEKAVEVVSEESKYNVLDTLAWARFGVGLDDGALEASRLAAESAPAPHELEYAGRLEQVEDAVEAARSAEGLAESEQLIAKLKWEHDALEEQIDGSCWTFTREQSNSSWWHDQLTKLILELESLAAPGSGLLAEDGVTPERGWSVGRRLALAKQLQESFEPDGECGRRWDEALPSICEAYPDLDLSVQMGLVPIGADPESGMWEFWHVQSGEEPLRRADGKLVIIEESGLVFVLLPGGWFWMGSQLDDPDDPNYDPASQLPEQPPHEVELSPFFLSKYEMTQGQWERATGDNPSFYGPAVFYEGIQHDLTHPVEQVSWHACVESMSRLGLTLPSEAQWEYGARGGTDTVWWTGQERESLQEKNAVNLADQAAGRVSAPWDPIMDWTELDDGYAAHAPVGTYAANGFGLHEVHGNVWEWCLDAWDPGFYQTKVKKDPVCSSLEAESRVYRGGSFQYAARRARSAYRGMSAPSVKTDCVGLRPARRVDP